MCKFFLKKTEMQVVLVLQSHFGVAVHFAFVATAEDITEDMGFAFEDDGGVAGDGTLGAAAIDAAGTVDKIALAVLRPHHGGSFEGEGDVAVDGAEMF